MIAPACCCLYLLEASLVAAMSLAECKRRRIEFTAKSRRHAAIGLQRDFPTTPSAQGSGFVDRLSRPARCGNCRMVAIVYR
jgi:hypothetical protein